MFGSGKSPGHALTFPSTEIDDDGDIFPGTYTAERNAIKTTIDYQPVALITADYTEFTLRAIRFGRYSNPQGFNIYVSSVCGDYVNCDDLSEIDDFVWDDAMLEGEITYVVVMTEKYSL